MTISHKFYIALVLFPFAGLAQSDSLQKQIDEQVWRVFISAYNSKNTEIQKSIHSHELIRVIKDNNQIMRYDEYFKKNPDSIIAKWAVWQNKIELRFTRRIASHDAAFETGYYKTTSFNTATNEKRMNYGKFQVLLRKENGKWKILMDADGHESTTEAIFMTGIPID